MPRPFCLSVHLSVCQTRGLSKKERNLCPHERSFILLFWEEEWLVGSNSFYLTFCVKLTLSQRKRRFSIDIRFRSAWAVVPSEKSSINNTNRTFTTRFPMSLRWTLYVAPKPPIWGSKTQNGRFPVQKLQFTWRKSAIKFLCLIYYQQQSCKTFTGLSISAEWFAEVRPMLRANLADTDQSSLITPISNQYSPVAPQP